MACAAVAGIGGTASVVGTIWSKTSEQDQLSVLRLKVSLLEDDAKRIRAEREELRRKSYGMNKLADIWVEAIDAKERRESLEALKK